MTERERVPRPPSRSSFPLKTTDEFREASRAVSSQVMAFCPRDTTEAPVFAASLQVFQPFRAAVRPIVFQFLGVVQWIYTPDRTGLRPRITMSAVNVDVPSEQRSSRFGDPSSQIISTLVQLLFSFGDE